MADHYRPRDRDAQRTHGINTAILAITIIIIIVGTYIWYKRDRLPDTDQFMPEVTEQAGPEQPAADGAEKEPAGPKYPVVRQPALDTEEQTAAEEQEKTGDEADETAAADEEKKAEAREKEDDQREQVRMLPPLEQSDKPLRLALTRQETEWGEQPQPQTQTEQPETEQGGLRDWFIPESMIRHFVVTVDNLPRAKIAWKYSFVEPAPGKFQVRGREGQDKYYLDTANFERYERYISYIESVDLQHMIDVYVQFYPLFQEAYEELGYPDRYFNDRLVEVIDHLLAAPVVQPPIKLVRPKVYYKYADPELEALSAGHKLLVRSGPDNSRRIKIWLRKVRDRLTSLGSQVTR